MTRHSPATYRIAKALATVLAAKKGTRLNFEGWRQIVLAFYEADFDFSTAVNLVRCQAVEMAEVVWELEERGLVDGNWSSRQQLYDYAERSDARRWPS